jgi:hypothetical protein
MPLLDSWRDWRWRAGLEPLGELARLRTEFAARHSAFERLSIDAPTIDVDTTDGYRPALSQIVAFVSAGIEGSP